MARIGIIGAGFWAAYFYLPFLRDHEEAEIVGVVRLRQPAVVRRIPLRRVDAVQNADRSTETAHGYRDNEERSGR